MQMQQEISQRLLSLNRQFYEHFAEAFAATRGPEQPGLRRLLPYLPSQGSLLDVGCGNGRLARLLDSEGRPLRYLGVDANAALLQIAGQQAAGLSCIQASFHQADVTLPGWAESLPPGPYQAITALALLHHAPSQRLRCQLLAALRSLLAEQGVLALSTWQFLNSPRLQRRIVPWQTIGIDPDQVEPRDYLLDWRRGGYGLRYCRWIDGAELKALAEDAGLHLRTTFQADGSQGNLNLFAILAPAGREAIDLRPDERQASGWTA